MIANAALQQGSKWRFREELAFFCFDKAM